MDLTIAGKTALVTGATAGIGVAIAKTLASEGVQVTISGRKREKLDSVAAEIAKGGGPKVATGLTDIASGEGGNGRPGSATQRRHPLE